jgi:hypothetical protein
MRAIIAVVSLVLCLIMGAHLSPVQAETCASWHCYYTTNNQGNTSQNCYGSPPGCDDSVYTLVYGSSCPAGQYVSNNGCTSIGGSCACGEFYK